MDEEYVPQGNVAYSLGKVLEEELARQFARRDPGLVVTGLRFSNITTPGAYAEFPSFEDDPAGRSWNLWAYIDVRDAAAAVRLALERSTPGFEVINIAAADTVMARPTAALMAEHLPQVKVREPLTGTGSLTSIEKAARVLGWTPRHSWRD
jgi:nucleoside-diphosphate-sugar epimerase